MQNSRVGQGHQEHDQNGDPQGGNVGHGGVHRYCGEHHEQIVHRAHNGEQPPALVKAALKLPVRAAQILPEQQLRQREEEQTAEKQDEIPAGP